MGHIAAKGGFVTKYLVVVAALIGLLGWNWFNTNIPQPVTIAPYDHITDTLDPAYFFFEGRVVRLGLHNVNRTAVWETALWIDNKEPVYLKTELLRLTGRESSVYVGYDWTHYRQCIFIISGCEHHYNIAHSEWEYVEEVPGHWWASRYYWGAPPPIIDLR